MSRINALIIALICVGVMVAAVWSLDQLAAVAMSDFYFPTCEAWSGQCSWVYHSAGVVPATVLLTALFVYFFSYWQLTRR